MSAVRFAVAGLKHFHIKEFVKGMLAIPGAEFVGFYDDDPELRRQFESESGARGFGSIDTLVATTHPEVVGVAEANGRKADTICRLMALGCHVLADKPLVSSLAGLDQLESAMVKTGKQVSLMLLERYHGPTRAVRQCLTSGDVGRLVNFTALAPHKLRPAGRPRWVFDPELYGGVLNDLAIHNVDIARWLWGEDPIAVSATEGCLRFTEFNRFSDHAEVFLEFADSSTAMIRADWLTPESFPSHGDGRQFYHCTAGTIEVLAAPDIHTLGQGEVRLDRWDQPRQLITPVHPSKSLYEEFVALCRGAESADLMPNDALRSTRITLLAREAARTHQRIDLRGRL